MLLLRNRAVAWLWTGQLLSQVGTRMYQLALAWWLVSRAGSGPAKPAGQALGAFMAAGALPSLLFVKPIGAFVERSDGLKTLIASDLFSFALVSLVAAALRVSRLDLPLLCASGFLLALSQAFFDPALNKALPALAAEKDLEQAVALQSSTQSLASFAGAVAGAFLIDRLGMLAMIWINALSFLVSAFCNARLRAGYGAFLPRPQTIEAAGTSDASTWAILDGLGLIKKVLIGFGLANFFMTPILVILPLYVSQCLGAGPGVLGGLEAGLWLGILFGTAASKWCHFTENIPKLGAGCLFLMGLCLFIPGLAVGRALYAALLFAAGAALGVNNVKFVALFQRSVPAELKGRFFALMQALLSFTFPAAYFAFGFLADWLGPAAACLIQGAGVMLLSFYFLALAEEAGREQPGYERA